MKRLTEKDKQGNWALKGVNWQQLRIGQPITKELQQKLYGALFKLIQYENTELSPEQVGNLREENEWIPVGTAMPREYDSIFRKFKGTDKWLPAMFEKTSGDIKLMYDNAYVPNTWTNGEMKVVDILQDLCLQNCVFGWMNRKGKFRYLKVKPNARVSGTSQSGKESYEYYDCSVHYDVTADENTDITEGRLWYPKEFLPDPYPGLFSPGDITAQEAYEENIYYIRDSFFIGNDDWIEYVFDADEYGSLTRIKPLMKICYGTPTQIDSQHLYIAQGYNVKVRGNPLTRIGSKIQLQIRKRTPPFQGYPEGKDIIWKINSYIMSRTMEITGRGIMETYGAENGPYNSNKSQEGRHTQTYKAETRTTRSKLPTISYKAFSSGEKAAGSTSDEIKKAPFKCIKKIQKDKYDAMLKAGQIRNDTLYCTWEED